MVIAFYCAVVLLTCVVLTALYFCLKSTVKTNETKILKIASLVLAGVFFVRFMLGQEVILKTVGLTVNSPLSTPFLTALGMISVWLTFASLVIVFVNSFFDLKWLNMLVRFFVLPASILNMGLIVLHIPSVAGAAALNKINFTATLMCVELGLMLCYSFYIFWFRGKFSATKQELKIFALSALAFLFSAMPAYALQVLIGFGRVSLIPKDFTIEHRILLYFSIIIPLVIYAALRKKDEKTKKAALIIISLGTMITYLRGDTFSSLTSLANWPLHLCNTAMFIIPICLIFKLNKLFYFTLFINVMGAFLAMLMPNTGTANILSYSLVSFWINHYIAFFMPILVVALGVYKRPRLREFIYSMAGFAIYFVAMLIINAWLTNTQPSVDFFFLNSDYIAEKLGEWAERLRDTTWIITLGSIKLIFYPIYQFLFFLVYVGFGLGMWFLYEQFFLVVDQVGDIIVRKKAIKLDHLALLSILNGRSEEQPMSEQNINKLVIKNLSKKYGNSEIFAVKDASMEVNCGEVFGFLGPNGAGKSTIIKSIVGIQPATSGSIEICGYDTQKQSVMAKRQVGFVPDHYALYEKLTGREYINYIADLYDVSKEDRDARIEKYVNLFELVGAFDNQMKTYSHGMKQKIAIMAALVHNPKLWILDEPLTGLDPNSIFQVKECMKNHAKEGNIVFFSSHIIDVVEKICDRITIIKKGQIQDTVSLKELESKNIKLEDYYLKTISGEK